MSVMNQPLCEKLRAAREARGLNFADVAHVTRIPVSRLQLLEEGNYAAFGSMTYARSFIRAYSRFLEVDAEDVIADLPGPLLGGRDDYRHLTQSYGPWVNLRGAQPFSMPVKPGRRGSPAFTALVLTLILATSLVVYASLYVVPGLVRKGQADTLLHTAAATAKPLVPAAQLVHPADSKGADFPTTYVDPDHPSVRTLRALPADSNVPFPLPQ
ncbi:MAG: helix-turn-helix protein [Verrucomicrobiaceae bacterium]|nr:helix-turn-helix protein [Verrucomicrobiaceae bacterium]